VKGEAIALLLAMAILFSGCIQEQPAQGEETIKIGAILPLTGTAADFGSEELGGIRVALLDVNQVHGQKIVLLVEDSKNDAKEGISALNKILNVDKADFVFGTMSSVGLAIKDTINGKKIPTIWVAAHPDLVKDNPWIFRNSPTVGQYTEKIVAVIEQKEIKKIGLFFISDDFGESLKSAFAESFSGEITDGEMFSKDGTDFRTEITKVLATNPDSIFVAGYGSSAGILIKQLRENGYNGSVFGPSEISTTSVKAAAEDALNGAIFADYSADYSQGEAKKFRDKYLLLTGREPGLDSVLGYEEARILLNAINATDGSREQVQKYISSLKNFPGLSGPINVNNNEFEYPLTIKTVKNGEFVLYEGD